MRLLIVLVAVALAFTAVHAEAKPNTGPSGQPTLTVTPDTIAVGGTIVIDGEGFHPRENLEVGVWGLPSVFLEADDSGAFSLTYSGFDLPGTGTAVALVSHGPNLVTRAEATFTVE